MLLESTLMFFITSSSLLIIHMCGVLLYSIIKIAKISNKPYIYYFIALMAVCIFISFLRPLLIHKVSVKSYKIEANIFCVPFITQLVPNTTGLQLGIEWSLLIIQVSFVISVIASMASIMFVVHKRQKTLNQNRNASSKTIIKLSIYIVMVIITKTPSLMIWFCVLLGVQIFPDALLLVVIGTLSIWPIFHPFMHTIGK